MLHYYCIQSEWQTIRCCCCWQWRMFFVVLPCDLLSCLTNFSAWLILEARFGCSSIHMKSNDGRQCAVLTQIGTELSLVFSNARKHPLFVSIAVWQSKDKLHKPPQVVKLATWRSSHKELLLYVMPQDIQVKERVFVSINWRNGTSLSRDLI